MLDQQSLIHLQRDINLKPIISIEKVLKIIYSIIFVPLLLMDFNDPLWIQKKNYCNYINKPVRDLTHLVKNDVIDTIPFRSYIGAVQGLILVFKNRDILEIYPQFMGDSILFRLKNSKVDYDLLDSLPIKKLIFIRKRKIVEQCGV